MSSIGSVGQVRRGSLASLALVVAPLLLVAAACGSGMENPNPKAANSAALLSSSKHSDAGTQYKFEFFNGPGSPRTIIWAINDFGVTTGQYQDAAAENGHGFVRAADGSFVTFDPVGSVNTFPLDINNERIIVGFFFDASGRNHGFKRLPNGAITQIDFPSPAVDSALVGINDLDEISAEYDLGDETTAIGVVLRDGHFKSYEVPGSAPMHTAPTGVNDVGMITGYYDDPAGIEHGYLFRDAKFTTVDCPGATTYTELFHANNYGQVVGYSDQFAFIYDVNRGSFDQIICPDEVAMFPVGINDRGQISGACVSGELPQFTFHGFIATPVRPDE